MFGVTGYPTLKWMPKGKTTPADAEAVNAGRDAEALSTFVSKKAGIKPKTAKNKVSVCVCVLLAPSSPLGSTPLPRLQKQNLDQKSYGKSMDEIEI